jgi:hypothetical protein
MPSFLILMVFVGNMHEREEEDSGHSHNDPLYEDGGGLEGDGDKKTLLTSM